MNTYQVGDLVRIAATFTDLDGVTPIDPTVVKFIFETPAGVETTYTFGVGIQLVKDSLGNYHVDVSATEPGDWAYRWESTGTGQAAEEGEFIVEPSKIKAETLKVEDGTIVAGADSYASQTYADTYHANRGNAAWSSVEDKEAALRKATDYMVQAYRARWKGYRKDGAQRLDWPRTWVYLEPFTHGIVGTYPFLVPDNIVPEEVKNACVEYALQASTSSLAPNLTRQTLMEKVGPIEVQYDPASVESTRYRAMDMMLAPYLTGGGANTPLIRS